MRFIKGFVFLIGLACFIVGAVGVVWMIDSRDVTGSAAPGVDITKTVPAAGIKSLNVNTDVSAIVFKPGSGNEIIAHFTGQVPESRKDEWTLTADTGASGTWNVEAASSKHFNIGFDFSQLITAIANGGFKLPMQLEITLPAQAYDNIVVHTDNGRIQLGDLQVDKIDASADNGTIELNSFKGKALKLHTNNGAIDFKSVTASDSIVADTKNGRVEGSLTELASPVTMTANNGTVSLDLPAGSPAQLDLSTNNGGIHMNASGNISYQAKEKHHIIAKIGAATHFVKLKTNNGRVDVNVN